MHKRTFISVFIFLSAIIAVGCTTTGSIGMDGRVSNLNDLADRISYKYNGLTHVKNAQPNLKHHRHYGDFAMTLFNVRATKGDVPDMVNTFRNYCTYIGGFQRDVGIQSKTPNSFSIICEPNEVYGKVRDPAYFLFFVNVLVSPNAGLHANVTDKQSVKKKKVKKKKVEKPKDVPYHTHPNHTHQNYGYPHKTNFDNTNRRNPNSDNANNQSKYMLKVHHQHSFPSNVLPPSTYQGHKSHGHTDSLGYTDPHAYKNPYNVNRYSDPYAAIRKNTNPYYLTPRNINPYYKAPLNTHQYHTVPHYQKPLKPHVPQNKKVYKAKGYCVNFLISENQTRNTVFTHMPHYEDYRKRFEAVLESTKGFC